MVFGPLVMSEFVLSEYCGNSCPQNQIIEVAWPESTQSSHAIGIVMAAIRGLW